MPAFNTSFELSIEDLDLIEDALRRQKRDLGEAELAQKKLPENTTLRSIHDLLGRLHNQKEFYRPRRGAFISG